MTKDQHFPTGFGRAIQMLSLAIAHVLYGNPDAARTNLRASWDCLKGSTIGRIEHMATAAFVSAVNGDVRHATYVLGITLDELDLRRYELPAAVRKWVWGCCIRTMERLPYARAINTLVHDAYNQAKIGNYAEALYLLTQANDELGRSRRFIPPRVAGSVPTAWNNILERMLADDNTSALNCVRQYSARLGQPAAA